MRRDLDLAALARLRGRPEAGRLQGLTVVEHRLAYRSDVAFRRRGGADGCAWLETLTVDASPPSATIYVPRDYPEGGCEAARILEHEREHEAIHRRALASLVVRLEKVLSGPAVPGPRAPVAARDEARARAALVKRVEAEVDPVYEGFRKALEDDQAAVDGSEAYRAATAACRGWK